MRIVYDMFNHDFYEYSWYQSARLSELEHICVNTLYTYRLDYYFKLGHISPVQQYIWYNDLSLNQIDRLME